LSGGCVPYPRHWGDNSKSGKALYISTCDLKGAFWKIRVKEDHQWLTTFVWDGGLYEFARAPFGQKGSGNSFLRAIKMVIQPLKTCAYSYVDDTAVFLQMSGHSI